MNSRHGLQLMVGLIALHWATAALAAPPFDCSVAKEQAEIALCDSPDLGLLDREMNRLYFDKRDAMKAAGKMPEADQLRFEQRNFLKTRNDCGYATACLTSLYKKRVEDLKKP